MKTLETVHHVTHRTADGQGNRWDLGFHFAEVDGRLECVGLDIRSFKATPVVATDEDGTPVVGKDGNPQATLRYDHLPGPGPAALTAAFVRQLPVGAFMQTARSNFKVLAQLATTRPKVTEETRAVYREAVEKLRARPRGHHGEEHFALVADIYRRAWADGDRAPTKAVADELNASRTAAAKWVARARTLGLLGEAEQGRAGGARPTTGDTKKGR